MAITLPLHDSYIDELAPLYEPGEVSLTQRALEQVMASDFPTVACLAIEGYAHRLLDIEYTDGTRVFYLDWTPELPGYVVLFCEPWTSSIGPDGVMCVNMRHYSGPEAARRAEQIRRLIPPGETHTPPR